MIQLTDLIAIANVTEDLFLMIKKGEENKENPVCINVNIGSKEIYIDNIQNFLKFSPFEEIDISNKQLQSYYRDKFYRNFSDDYIIGKLSEFNK